MPSLIDQSARLCQGIVAGIFLVSFLGRTPALRAGPQSSALPVAGDTVITNFAQFWTLASDPAVRSRWQRIHADLLIYYCDTNWTVAWGRSDGLDTYLPFRGLPREFKPGQEVLIDGWALPVGQEIAWDRTSIKVLSENNPIEVVHLPPGWDNPDHFKGRMVEMDLLVDSVQPASATVLKLGLLTNDFRVTAYVHVSEPVAAWPDFSGKTVRLRGVFAATSDSAGKSNPVLWTPGLNQIKVIGSLDQDPRFDLPLVSSAQFESRDTNNLIRVRGLVRSQQPGEAVTIWDDAGQIRILTWQEQPLQLNDRVEAIGYPEIRGIDRVLRMGLFRRMAETDFGGAAAATNNLVWPLADQVRGLDQETLAQHPPVSLLGVVTWVDVHTNYIVVQDSSGGIRVLRSRLQSGRRIRVGMLVAVEGVATTGEFAPVITNAVVRQTGFLTLPEAPFISLEQALTGTEDGRWVQMRGYVRRVTETNGLLDLQLMAPAGEFVAHVPGGAADVRPGSVVLVTGVCGAVANARRQLTGVEIYSPLPEYVQIEQSAPPDLFAQPQRPLASLRQFNRFNSLNKRVRTVGTLTLQAPGRYLYLQDGDSSLFALSSQTNSLSPGDRVEIVGFSGNDGGRFLLREAAFRRLAAGPEPAAVCLTNVEGANEDWDGLLVRAQGSLLEVVGKPDETRLVLEAGGHIFEARLDRSAALTAAGPRPGSHLALTGVYTIQREESGKPAAFLLQLRDGNDVHLLAPPPWWTLRRLSLLLAGSGPVLLLGLFWGVQTRRKNRQLERAKNELTAAQAQLEERVRERTRELNEESEARKRALVRLSEAQQRLIHASRQAGMAEVATGILHNVGNILNSVNVSASVIDASLKRLRIRNFSQAAALLAEHDGNLAKFLTEDDRGRALPGYLRQLAGAMAQNERTLHVEVESLIKQIDHVKAVVAWQQGYARSSGFYETFQPAELMDDALQINHGAFERDGIEVVRDYGDLPPIMSDRNKIFQILVNLLSNAKQALATARPRRLVVAIRLAGQDRIRFEVSDTGIGIPPENLERIFSMGFTTKPGGHGFGLHSGANCAQEMGGRLFALSEGSGRGATFVLELPVAPKTR